MRRKVVLESNTGRKACQPMSLWLGMRNNSDANRTFADPMVGIEALSAARQAVTLMKSPGMDAGCTVRGCRSRAAGTRDVTH